MTTDTSREAVEALIAELRKDAKRDAAHRNEHARATRFNRKTMPSWVSADVLAALLDERDTARDASVWRDTIDEQRAYIRDLEAINRKISERSANHHDNAIKWQERAERAEAELLHARGRSEIRGAERDKLAAKLDAVKAVVTGWNGFTGLTREVLAILADTDEGNEK